MTVDAELVGLALGPAEAGVGTVGVHGGFPRLLLGLFLCTAVSRAALVGLAVEEKVAEDAGGRPEEAVSPAFDAGLVLVKDKDGAGSDHLAFAVDEPAGDPWYDASSGGLEHEERIARGRDPSGPRGFRPAARGRGGGRHQKFEVGVASCRRRRPCI